MPDIKVEVEIKHTEVVWIDVICASCGRGLCNLTSVDPRNNSFTVVLCPSCIKEKDDIISSLEYKIERLEALHGKE